MARAGLLVIEGKDLANGVLPVCYQGRTGRKDEHEPDFLRVSPECHDETDIGGIWVKR